ncbi:F0F1 ATP synthase subunit epsilon [Aquirhabdus parva]|uniref:ATP synthase epsilon chain n=1 Tax=Aquirhabdus parva TaxID=2283318 RepID=A0A345PAD0_9GAMM|nr:F0F1 ATP synthase subunit epsilon [Aquirhabdus parva]AXI04239.1 F0F1 ATP synthase subunit epsilon [Aquirhabdus parva]
MATLHCDVVSVGGSIFSGDINMLIADGIAGQMGILPGHAPLVTLLKPSALRVQHSDGHEEQIYVSGGVLEVQPHVVTVLADTAIHAANLDEAKILEARQHAESLLANQKGDFDAAAALSVLAETAAQLQTLQRYKYRAQV